MLEDIPGGTPAPGLIVPDGVPRYEGQVTESAFLRRLAVEIVDRLPNVPGHGDEARDELVATVHEWLVLARDRLIGLGNLEQWLRDRLQIGPEVKTVDAFLERLVARLDTLDLGLVATLPDRVAALPEDERRGRTGGIDVPASAAAVMRGAAHVAEEVSICIAECLPCRALEGLPVPGSIPPTSVIGQLVHLSIQEHYLLTHPGHRVLMDSVIRGPEGRTTIYQIAKPGAGFWGAFGSTLRFALMTIKARTKLPDIMDLTTGDVYEIKPRRQVQEGVEQLCLNYVGPYNSIALATGMPGVRPGFAWRASLLYPVPPDMVVMTVQCPGLIVYDLFKIVPPQQVPEYVPAGSPQRQTVHREIPDWAIALGVAALAVGAVLLLPIDWPVLLLGGAGGLAMAAG